MNNIAPTIFLVFFGGTVLGWCFFYGLWWTVQRGLRSAQPALWFIASAVLRFSLVITGVYFMAGNDWPRLVACLVGFMAARFLLTRVLQLPTVEAQHASKP